MIKQISPSLLMHRLFHPGASLSQRVMQAGFWAFGQRFSLRILKTVRTIVLARLLAPQDFGIMGIALLMMSLLETFSQTGFRNALVQRQGDIRPYLDTAWVIQILRGLLLGGILALGAPLAASFFDAPNAVSIIRVIAIALVIDGFNNIGIVYFQKELEFQKRFLISLLRVLPEVAVGIGLAIAWQNVWALVYGVLAGNVAYLVASYVFHPYRPRPRLEWAKAKEMYHFGKWVFGSSILGYLLNHLDDIMVGKVLGPAALGLYRMAHTLSQMTATELTHVTNQVAFPAYAKAQAQVNRLRAGYLEGLQMIALLVFPLGVGMALLAPELVAVVLGENWLPMVPAFQVLALFGIMRSLGSTTGPFYQGIGKPGIATKLQFLKILVFGVMIFPLTSKWGLTGAALSVLLSSCLTYPVGIWVACRVLGCSYLTYFRYIMVPALAAGLMGGAIYGVRSVALDAGSIGSLIVLVLAGASCYLAAVWMTDHAFQQGILRSVRKRLSLSQA